MIKIDKRFFLNPTQVKELLTSTKRVADKRSYLPITKSMVKKFLAKQNKALK